MQEPLEAGLEDEEKWRNGRRLDQMYVSPSHPLCPEIYDLGSKAEQEPDKIHSAPMNPQLTGALPSSLMRGMRQRHTVRTVNVVQLGWWARCWRRQGRCAPWWSLRPSSWARKSLPTGCAALHTATRHTSATTPAR